MPSCGCSACGTSWRLHPKIGVQAKGRYVTRVIVFEPATVASRSFGPCFATSTHRADRSLCSTTPREAQPPDHGVPIVGGRQALRSTEQRFDPGALAIAIPSADAPSSSRSTNVAEEAGLEVKLLPRVSELIFGMVAVPA